MKHYTRLSLLILLSLGISKKQLAQDTAAIHQHAPRVFIDCQAGCDMQYLQNQMQYLNFVRDMRLCDVYIMMTGLTNGGGGRQYTLLITDEKTMKTDTVKWSVPPNNPDAETRELMLKKVKTAMLPFIAATLSEFVEFNIPMPKIENEPKKKDKWNSWTFNLGANGWGGGNSYNLSVNTGGWLTASRVTKKSKFDLSLNGNYSFAEFKFNGTNEKVERSGYGAFNRKIWSLGEHFSTGWFASYTASTVNNLQANATFYPALEYNLFPYEQASHKICRIVYRAGVRYQKYLEQTVYDNLDRVLYPHSLIVDLTIIEKWGTIDVALGGTHYFNMKDNYSGTFSPNISLNLFKGFRINIWGSYTVVNDQFFLRKASASSSEILLGAAALKTNYNFSCGGGISYSFGSIYNNAVNVRMDIDRNMW